MPRQAHHNKQQGKQEKTKKANRLGSCRLLAKKGESHTNFEWACRCFSQTNACSAEIILKLQMNNTTDSNIEVSVFFPLHRTAPSDHTARGGRQKHWIKVKNCKHPAMSRVKDALEHR